MRRTLNFGVAVWKPSASFSTTRGGGVPCREISCRGRAWPNGDGLLAGRGGVTSPAAAVRATGLAPDAALNAGGRYAPPKVGVGRPDDGGIDDVGVDVPELAPDRRQVEAATSPLEGRAA